MDGKWHYSLDHGQLCQVIETQTRWGEPTCRVWLPGRNSVVRSPASRLKPLESAGTSSPGDIAYGVSIEKAAQHRGILPEETRGVVDCLMIQKEVDERKGLFFLADHLKKRSA